MKTLAFTFMKTNIDNLTFLLKKHPVVCTLYGKLCRSYCLTLPYVWQTIIIFRSLRSVACRQLGYPLSETASATGTDRNSRRRTGVFSAYCSGTESRLIDCRANQYSYSSPAFFQSTCYEKDVYLSCCSNSICTKTQQREFVIMSGLLYIPTQERPHRSV